MKRQSSRVKSKVTDTKGILMDEIIIENIRCFYDSRVVPLRRLTFLIGENSTGKSTFLALTRFAWDLTNWNFVNFNDDAFQLGSYQQIASKRGGPTSGAGNFRLGVSYAANQVLESGTIDSKIKKASIIGTFVNDRGTPRLRDSMLHAGSYSVQMSYEETGERRPITIISPSGTFTIKDNVFLGLTRNFSEFFRYLPSIEQNMGRVEFEGSIDGAAFKSLQYANEIIARQVQLRPFAFAPIRTRPMRTYDLMADYPTPEGFHVPMVMAKYATYNQDSWERLKDQIQRFGRDAGLFSEIVVSRLGTDEENKESAPFQINVKISARAFNLLDVGYGVSQVLPIIFDTLAQSGSTFLLQQPEVHLHPRAQAALGSFLAALVKEQNKQFIIETHSDYIVDRVRYDVRKKVIDASDVLILYFERENGGVRISPIELDEKGNILNAPESYRQFFLEEEMRVLAG